MLTIPRFERRVLTRRRQHSELDECFEQLVRDILDPSYPGLRRFEGRGKDGAIDLSAELGGGNGLAVVECKLITKDGAEAARRRWREVAGHLRKHLASADGPTPGQSQYQPWYRTDRPIRSYTFCVSSILTNQNQRDALDQEICDFFKDLATERAHLAHLADLEVEIMDWSDLGGGLAARPHLAYQWFPGLLPRGLASLESAWRRGTFRAYLSSETLPFYSRAEHLALKPATDPSILDEDGLLDRLFDDSLATGLVISGSGGVGKSRLALELGHRTIARGGTAARTNRFTEESVEAFAEGLDPKQRALLVIDYVESMPHFEEAVARLAELVDETGIQLRLVATCRTSFFPKVAAIDGIRRLDLSAENADKRAWLEDYRLAAIHRILLPTGLLATDDEQTAKLLEICRDTPALAVFLAYLQSVGGGLDLQALLDEPDFGGWIHRQVRKSFPERQIHRQLALWMGLMPLPRALPPGLRNELGGDLFDRLATDRWIELLDDGDDAPHWVSAHDVLADRIVLSYLDTIRQQAAEFVEHWLELGRRSHALESALIALQRLARQEPIQQVDFVAVFRHQLAQHPDAWRPFLRKLVRSPLLEVAEVLELLDRDSAVWQGANEDPVLHGVLGILTRRVVGSKGEGISHAQHQKLVEWLTAAAPHVEKSNFLLTWALQLAPEGIRSQALRWLSDHPFKLQTHFLLVAWLRAGLPPQEVATRVKDWATAFSHRPALSFLAKAWLDAGGKVATVEDGVIRWLQLHGATEPAKFVFISWLDAGGELEAVTEIVQSWLKPHGTTESARFVLRSWLNAGGELEAVADVFLAWLARHGTTEPASFMLKNWLDEGGELDAIAGTVLRWLGKHGETEAAHFLLKSWLDAGGELEVVAEAVLRWLEQHGTTERADFMLKSWIDAGGELEAVTDFVIRWLEKHGTTVNADFVLRSWLEANGDFDVVKDVAIAWLAQYRTLPDAVFVTKFLARQSNLPITTVRDILVWCRTHPSKPEAIWRFSRLRYNLLHPELSDEVVRTAEVVLEPVVKSSADMDLGDSRPALGTFWLLIDLLGSSPSTEKRRLKTDLLFADWLRHGGWFAIVDLSWDTLQRPAFLLKIVDLLRQGLLDAEADREGLESFCLWVNQWRLDAKLQTRQIIAYLRRTYPQVDYWDRIEFQ